MLRLGRQRARLNLVVGRVDEAIGERLNSLEAGEDFFYGMTRLVAREKLGQLYETKGDAASGAEMWRFEMGAAISVGPACADGRIYAGQQGGDRLLVRPVDRLYP